MRDRRIRIDRQQVDTDLRTQAKMSQVELTRGALSFEMGLSTGTSSIELRLNHHDSQRCHVMETGARSGRFACPVAGGFCCIGSPVAAAVVRRPPEDLAAAE